MGLDLKIKNYLEYKHGEGTATCSVGDNVVCEAGGKLYIGKITFVGYYRKDKDSEPQPAIYIDTSKTKTSYSGELFQQRILHIFIMIRLHTSRKPYKV